jgi:hypothetical protein
MAKKKQNSGATLCKCSKCGKSESSQAGSTHRWVDGAKTRVGRAKRKACGGTWG